MRLCLLLCLVLLSPRGASLGRHHSRETKKRVLKLPPAVATVAPGIRDFTFDLYRTLAAASPEQNVFFSPLSISMSLAMLSLGAQSSTKAQILEGLGLNPQEGPEEELHSASQRLLRELGQPREDLQLSLGNALFTKPTLSIQEAFLGTLRTRYLADVFPTDFEDPEGAQKQINNYVVKQTKGKIVDLVKGLDGTEVMVMVNYIFFKAKWETSFNHKITHEQDFHVTSETVVRVPMMKREDQFYYLLDRNLSCKVVGVPYQGNATAFFVLPQEGGMEQVEKGLKEKTLRKWLKMSMKRQLELHLPKFSIEGSYQLENVLPKLGIRDVFTSHADLTGISNTSNIQVSEMVHKAVVEVDESGTKAAAATGTIFMFRSARISSQRIVFNRPFLMFIVENSKNILFVGKVTHP
ncbi:plasma serine protease inhibitor [Sus scrofa]|uniref:Plasma serine protease inhibitor preproprotein n=2 Tax=Sus scrofa TaxID=9823 RepID=A0A4X1SGC6_PIG|nr:plasma serine protease inhibitor [Sus scrofa]XP_005666477.1 plasma serine protease inhibitor [Sus scrofa]XP_005666478.1 plasma serine protease inhibitor [Sus scrofa]